jgi:hypothetical protein
LSIQASNQHQGNFFLAGTWIIPPNALLCYLSDIVFASTCPFYSSGKTLIKKSVLDSEEGVKGRRVATHRPDQISPDAEVHGRECANSGVYKGRAVWFFSIISLPSLVRAVSSVFPVTSEAYVTFVTFSCLP